MSSLAGPHGTASAGQRLKFISNVANAWNQRSVEHANQIDLTRLQRAAVQLLAPAYSIGFAIETLISTRHLFAAELLLRPLIERIAVLNFLHAEGETALGVWERGWEPKDKDRPRIRRLLDYVPELAREPDGLAKPSADDFKSYTLRRLHAIVHPDPVGSLRCLSPDADGETFRMISGPMVDNQVRVDEVATLAFIFVSALLKVTERTFPHANWPLNRPSADHTVAQVLES